jgi:hypothetical protein
MSVQLVNEQRIQCSSGDDREMSVQVVNEQRNEWSSGEQTAK